MKIAFVITSKGWGGLEMNVLKLAKFLTQKGYTISLITQEQSTIYQKGKGIFADILFLKMKRKYFDFSDAKTISTFLQSNAITTVMVCDNKDLDIVAWAKRLYFKVMNIVYHQQMQIGVNKKDFLHTFRYKTINRWISPLEYLKKEIATRTHYPIDRVRVIPLGVDISKFTPHKYTKQQALEMLNISPKHHLVGIIGRIDKKKGQLFLVESLLKLQQKGIDIEVLIFGSATVDSAEGKEYYQSIHEFVRHHHLEYVVHFVDYQEDVALFYNAVDVFVLASHSETFGMVTIEAMLSSVPVVATKSGGTSEIVEYGNLGALYEFDNHEDFCEQLVHVLSSPSETEAKVHQAYKTAVANYNVEDEISAIDLVIRELEKQESAS